MLFFEIFVGILELIQDARRLSRRKGGASNGGNTRTSDGIRNATHGKVRRRTARRSEIRALDGQTGRIVDV